MGLSILPKWRPLILLSGISLGLCFCLASYGQRTRTRQKAATISPCTLDLKDAPIIRGVRLGMPVDEFLKMFPSASERENSRPEVGAITYEVNQEENPNFADSGVELQFVWFVDEALSSIGFRYPEYEPTSIDDFVRQAAAKLGLPSVGWKNLYGNREIKCRGFNVLIGQEVFKAGIGDPYLILSDNASDAKIIAREKEMKRKEAEQRRRKEQERRIFKP